MRICYLIQTHNYPEQIYRLVRTLKFTSDQCLIIINHDFTKSKLDLTPLEDLSNIYLLKRTSPSKRANFSCIKPYLDTIKWLLKNKYDFDWLIYISGQDYPTQSTQKIEQFLAQTSYDGFISYWNIMTSGNPWGRGGFWRYYCQYYPLPDLLSHALDRIFRSKLIKQKLNILEPIFLTKNQQIFLLKNINNQILIGSIPSTIPFDRHFHCYGGWQWHTLSRKCVEYIYQFIQEDRNLIAYYKRVIIPEESLIQTILVNSQRFNLYNDNKRYIDFSQKRSDGHPRTIDVDDYQEITSDRYHFARKFDPESSTQIVKMLDRKIASIQNS